MPDAKRGGNLLNNVAGHVDWAFANGITTGMDYGAFDPDTACSDCNVPLPGKITSCVCFYRALVEAE